MIAKAQVRTKKSTADMLTGSCLEPREALQFRAQMAELVDAPASGAGVLMDVEVRVLFWAPFTPLIVHQSH